MRNPREERLDNSPANYEAIRPVGYRNFLACPWPGEAVILLYEEGRFAGIFTDHKEAAGVFPVNGQDDRLASDLAKYFLARHEAGDSPTQVFHGLLVQFGIDEVVEVNRLDQLTELSAPFNTEE